MTATVPVTTDRRDALSLGSTGAVMVQRASRLEQLGAHPVEVVE